MPSPSYDEEYAYLEQRIDALKTNKTGDERQTEGEVFDKKTLMTIYTFMKRGLIDKVHYPISTGKEGNVFYATDEDGDPLALKIYRTSTSTFKRVSKYIEGDPRFKGITGNRWKFIYAWAAKEYRNLERYYEMELPVPEPIANDKNCLLMEYIGDEQSPAPQLKDAYMENPTEVYDDVVSFIIDGWRDSHLVHGDLSEYNILLQDGEIVVIDVGQAMTNDFFNAKELLDRDIANINRFFKNRGADIIDPEKIKEEVFAPEDEDEDDDEDEEFDDEEYEEEEDEEE
ncbi:MAG: serine protein kinase RIO [archaeon]|nr:serine protein kinase RIO [archaeon]